MIYFGSGAAFGRENWKPLMSESYLEDVVPKDQYGLSKYIMSKHAKESDNIYNLRIFGLYGKYDDWRYRFVSNACCKAVLGEDIVIKKDKAFDYLYIDDLIDVVKWAIENDPPNKVYNVCSSQPKTYSELAQEIIDASGKNLNIVLQNSKLDKEYSGDNSLLKKDMKDFKLTSTKQAIKYLYEWYSANKLNIKKELLLY
jgi:GDP-L-fucose synthase